MFEIQCGKKQQDDRVCMGHFWICVYHLTDCLRKKFGDDDFKENSGSIRASCSQKCRDRGKSKA